MISLNYSSNVMQNAVVSMCGVNIYLVLIYIYTGVLDKVWKIEDLQFRGNLHKIRELRPSANYSYFSAHLRVHLDLLGSLKPNENLHVGSLNSKSKSNWNYMKIKTARKWRRNVNLFFSILICNVSMPALVMVLVYYFLRPVLPTWLVLNWNESQTETT